MKFTMYEANGIALLIAHSLLMIWLHALFGVKAASYVIGVLELSTAAALMVWASKRLFSALGGCDVYDDLSYYGDLLLEHAKWGRDDGRWISGNFIDAWLVFSERYRLARRVTVPARRVRAGPWLKAQNSEDGKL
jgi:hypothetical protein